MRKLLLVAVLPLAVAGCGQVEKQNAHRSTNVDRSPAEVLAMPNYFNNVATKCDGHGHRVYVTSNKEKSPSNITVVDDETCVGGNK